MDTEKARVYLTAMESGSFSAAAEKLGYTISGISRSVASLEAETGIRLFERSKNGVMPTKDALELVPVMRELVHQEELLKEKARAVRGLTVGSLTIGVSYDAYFRMISDVIRRFRADYPGVSVRITQGASSQLIRSVEAHQADLAIVTRRESNLNFQELLKDPMVACVPQDHPAVRDGFFPLKQFETEQMICPYSEFRTDYRIALEEAGVNVKVGYATTGVFAAYCMVEAGLGVALLNRIEVEMMSGKAKILPTLPEVTMPIGIMYPDRDKMSLAAGKFLDLLNEMSRKEE